MSDPLPPRDCEVHTFDDQELLDLIPGEFCLATVTRVEDIKAHLGRWGKLRITNIRLIWQIPEETYINASIGYRTVVSSSVASGVQAGASLTEILSVRCKYGNSMYEFMFSAARGDPSVFRFFDIAYANYAGSSILRDQKLRSTFVQDGNLVMLADEHVMLSLDGLANFSGDVAKVGKAVVTNLRFVWFSGIVNNFNVSIPLILLPALRAKKSRRYGKCLYLKFTSGGTGFVYGFTIRPDDQMVDFVEKLERIRSAAMRQPRLTPPIDIREKVVKTRRIEVDEVLDVMDADPALRYIPCDCVGATTRGPAVFDCTLGLLIERLPDGESLSQRWKMASETPLVGLDAL